MKEPWGPNSPKGLMLPGRRFSPWRGALPSVCRLLPHAYLSFPSLEIFIVFHYEKCRAFLVLVIIPVVIVV